ncbi:MAG: CehA/McbA family metallohydrolase [Deltaproteobacteria bacterium]|nr:CehA/McbA family metallohydrolase [Deltaproteobacteria bacterium]
MRYQKKNFYLHSFLYFLSFLIFPFFLNSCGGGSGPSSTEGGVFGPFVTGDPNTFRGAGVIGDSKYLIGGPLAQGRVGDVLFQNDKIRLVIQKPRRNAGVSLFGGNIIDGDVLRAAGEPGRDQFGITFPLVNISWTPYYQKLEILNADFSKGPVIMRASGVLSVYDYIQTSIIVPFARLVKNVTLSFPDQYNDVLNPFENMPALKKVSTNIVTDYILRQDRNYLIIQTHFLNEGDKGVKMPLGDWYNSSGTLETFIPGAGFTGQGLYSGSLPAGVPAIVSPGMETTTGVSYGIFFDPTLFTKKDGTIFGSDVLTVSGVSVLGAGERVAPGLIPLGSAGTPPSINFELPPGETIFTRYFAIGNGGAGPVLDGGYQALGVPTNSIQGTVKDAHGQPVSNAKVIVLDNAIKKPVTMFYSDANGNFSGTVSTGADAKAKMFGSGQYSVEVYKEGYSDAVNKWPEGAAAPQVSIGGKNKAGICQAAASGSIQCTLGQSGMVQVSAKDESGQNVPARIAVVGFDPSPYHKLPKADDPQFQADDSSILSDIEFGQQQYGYVDVFFINAQGKITNEGNPRFIQNNVFRLEPGSYEIFVLRGPEYSMFKQRITVAPDATASVQATLKKVVDTSGYVSGDFHIHGINSPDSPFGQEARVNFGLAEGLDIMVSADHDAVTNYQEYIDKMGVNTLITSITGMEITPMAFGHFIAFPLLFDPQDPTGGAFDYTKKEGFTPGPTHHELLAPEELLTKIDQQNPGEQVLQVNHIMDNTLGNFALGRLVTTTHFDGVPALSTYSDPVEFRLPPNTNTDGGFVAPFPMGTNKLFTDKFTAVEICIGESAVVPLPHILSTALPTWFDLLNLGKVATATCSSDTHRQIREPVGILRNFVESSVDPRDGAGKFSDINPENIAKSVNQRRVIVSGGPFMRVNVAAGGQSADVGEILTLSGSGPQNVTLNVHIESPDWMDWDEVEVFVNTDPTPAKDDLSGPWDKSAKEFVSINPPHVEPRYIYSPLVKFKRGGGGGTELLNQSVSAGKRIADISKALSLSEDSWIVVMVKGGDGARTLFPYAPKAVNTKADNVAPAQFLDTLDAEYSAEGVPSKIGGSKAFAFSNPILVDIDGNGWQAKYVKAGKSPFKTSQY